MIAGALLTAYSGARNYLAQAGRQVLAGPRRKEVDVDDPARALQRAIYNGRQEAVIPLVQKLLEEKEMSCPL